MSQYENLLYAVNENVATITINRPHKMNSFTRELRRELLAAVEQVSRDESVRVVILAAAGRAFCAGADLTEEKPVDWSVTRELAEEYKPIILAIQDSPKLFITAVQGAAAGAGSAFALAGDLCVMSDDAYLYEAFAAIGLVPDCGASWFLTRQIGQKMALEIILSGERVSAQRCVELGLANRVVAAEHLMEEVGKVALAMSKKAPLVVQYSKKLVQAVPHRSLSEVMDLESQYQYHCINSEESAEAIAAFVEKRKPSVTGR